MPSVNVRKPSATVGGVSLLKMISCKADNGPDANILTCVTPLPKVIDVNSRQSVNIFFGMTVTLSGITILLIFVRANVNALRAEFPNDSSVDGNVTLSNAEANLNAPIPISVTPSGIAMLLINVFSLIKY